MNAPARQTKDGEPTIHIKGIEKTYVLGEENVVRALAGVDLAIYQGEFVAIMGPSGSGKSTMLNLLGCLDRPTAGQYFLDGEDVSRMPDDELSAVRGQRIGFIFQSYNLIAQLTVIENIQVPLLYQGVDLADYHDHCVGLAKLVGLGDRLDHRPNQLSGGQQQRVAIARAIVADPKVLLCDEPTGDLDRKSADEILETLQLLNKELGKTIVMVTHDPSAAKYARRELHLDKGRFVEQAQEPAQ